MKIANIVYTRKFECPDNINIVKTFEEALDGKQRKK